MNEYKFLLISLMIIYIHTAILINNTPLAPTPTIPMHTPTPTVPASSTSNIFFFRRFFILMYLSYSAILFNILQAGRRIEIEIKNTM